MSFNLRSTPSLSIINAMAIKQVYLFIEISRRLHPSLPYPVQTSGHPSHGGCRGFQSGMVHLAVSSYKIENIGNDCFNIGRFGSYRKNVHVLYLLTNSHALEIYWFIKRSLFCLLMLPIFCNEMWQQKTFLPEHLLRLLIIYSTCSGSQVPDASMSVEVYILKISSIIGTIVHTGYHPCHTSPVHTGEEWQAHSYAL